jgi:hypothetical protein
MHAPEATAVAEVTVAVKGLAEGAWAAAAVATAAADDSKGKEYERFSNNICR